MTLSDKRIQEVLAKEFVCARLDTEGDEHAGGSFAHAPDSPSADIGRGLGEKNLQLLMLTPKGELLHVVSGSIGTDDLARELKRALAIWKQVAKAEGADAKKEAVRAAHRSALKEIEKREPDRIERLLLERGVLRKSEGVDDDAGERKPLPVLAIGRGRDAVDHRFARDHALLPAAEFRPEQLVGTGRSFFGASCGAKPEEEIGTPRRRPDAKAPGPARPAPKRTP